MISTKKKNRKEDERKKEKIKRKKKKKRKKKNKNHENNLVIRPIVKVLLNYSALQISSLTLIVTQVYHHDA